jgi:hypothetical protein
MRFLCCGLMSARGGMFSARELRAGRFAFQEVGHDKIITPVMGCSLPRRRVETAGINRPISDRQGCCTLSRNSGALTKELTTEIRASSLRTANFASPLLRDLWTEDRGFS